MDKDLQEFLITRRYNRPTSNSGQRKTPSTEPWRTYKASTSSPNRYSRDALLKQYEVDVDVTKTYLYLYLPKTLPWYASDLGGVVTRTVSLLDAALHNFSSKETCEADSDFISQPDARGHFDILPIKRKMTIAQFQTLCRELDIGARYNKYLEEQLKPKDGLAQGVLKRKLIESDKAAFKAAAQLAVLTGDIDADARDLILSMLDGQRNLTRKGWVMEFCELSILDSRLTGIVLLTARPEQRVRDRHAADCLCPARPGTPAQGIRLGCRLHG